MMFNGDRRISYTSGLGQNGDLIPQIRSLLRDLIENLVIYTTVRLKVRN